MTDRQTEAVVTAIRRAGEEWLQDAAKGARSLKEAQAKAAIAASDARLVPALVEALKRIAAMDTSDASLWPASDEAREVLRSLPEEYRG